MVCDSLNRMVTCGGKVECKDTPGRTFPANIKWLVIKATEWLKIWVELCPCNW